METTVSRFEGGVSPIRTRKLNRNEAIDERIREISIRIDQHFRLLYSLDLRRDERRASSLLREIRIFTLYYRYFLVDEFLGIKRKPNYRTRPPRRRLHRLELLAPVSFDF